MKTTNPLQARCHPAAVPRHRPTKAGRASATATLRRRVRWPATIVAGLAIGALSAQAGEPAMPGMDSGRASPTSGGPAMTDTPAAPSMDAMMGAPLPFGTMIGRAGHWMVGYQYMLDRLYDNLDGTDRVSDAEVLARFRTTPTGMTMQTHMGMVMYAPTDGLSLMAMIPYVAMSMGELHRDATRSTERSHGVGDVELHGLFLLHAAKDLHSRMLVSLGIALPTGSVSHLDATGARLEYPMQTGSGTFSAIPGLTYLGQALPLSWGAEFTSTVRLGTNTHGYRLGHRYEPRIWVARQLRPWVSVTTGVDGEFWESIRGVDTSLDPIEEPTKDPKLQGGSRLNGVVGFTLHPSHGFAQGQQLLLQGEVPAVQSLDGPQLQRRFMIRIAWEWEL